MIPKIRGTQDFLDLTLFNYIIKRTSAFIECYGFTEIMTPILEPVELFKRSLGLHTDVVTKEMFIVNSEGQEQICLRPEVTASTMRAFLEHNIQDTPWKVYSWGPMFRHERPQKGRYRQFNQINIEVINGAAIAHDVQLIKMLDRLFQEHFMLDNYALLINFIGCAQDRERFKQELAGFLDTITDKLCENCKVRKEKNILRVFDCKVESCKELYKKAPSILDYLCTSCAQEWKQVQEQLALLSVSYTVVPTLVRGLDYYDKTVFEFVSNNLGAQNAFCGGGRYNTLATQLGSKQDYPSLGVSIGVERVMLLLEPLKDRLPLVQRRALYVIVPLTPSQQSLALLLADELQAQGLCTDVLFDGSVKSMMRKASKMGASHCLILGEDEVAQRSVMVKNMVTAQQESVKQVDVIAYLKK